jgi:hypothetical protein
MGIFQEVHRVIKVHELMTACLPVDRAGNEDQQEDRQCLLFHSQW